MNIQSTTSFPKALIADDKGNKEELVETAGFKDELAKMDNGGSVDKVKIRGGEDKSQSVQKLPDNSDDSKVEITESKKQKFFGPSAVKKETKEGKVKKFMDSLESDFQVEPTRLVEVLGQLSDSEKQQPIESNWDKVADGLNLTESDSGIVRQRVTTLVDDINKIQDEDRTKEKLESAATPLALSGGFSSLIGQTKQRFEQSQGQRKALRESLGAMNQNFWSPQTAPLPKASLSIPQADLKTETQVIGNKIGPSKIQNYQEWESAENLNSNSNLLPADLGLGAAYFGSEMSERSPNDDVQTNQMALDIRSEMPADPQSEKLSYAPQGQESLVKDNQTVLNKNQFFENKKLEPLLSQNNSYYKSDPGEAVVKKSQFTNVSQLDVPSEIVTKDALFIPTQAENGQFNLDLSQHKPSDLKMLAKSDKTKASTSDEVTKMFAGSLGLKAEQPAEMSVKAVPLGSVQVAPHQAENNMNQIIQNAQVLVNKGGGTMKIKMSPEGLGDIQLKVELKQGRVQLSMMTETKEAKKMLESNISDLRESLGHQKIALDSVRIDSVAKVNTDNSSLTSTLTQHQNQNSSQFEDSKQQRQFWNQFQDQFGRGSQREALFEPPRPKGYAPKSNPTIKPADSVSEARASGRSGLNIVA